MNSYSVVFREQIFFYFCGCGGTVVPRNSISVVAEELWFLEILFLWLRRNCGSVEHYFCGCGGTVVPWNSISVVVEELWFPDVPTLHYPVAGEDGRVPQLHEF